MGKSSFIYSSVISSIQHNLIADSCQFNAIPIVSIESLLIYNGIAQEKKL